jgi:hypothetical protein
MFFQCLSKDRGYSAFWQPRKRQFASVSSRYLAPTTGRSSNVDNWSVQLIGLCNTITINAIR